MDANTLTHIKKRIFQAYRIHQQTRCLSIETNEQKENADR